MAFAQLTWRENLRDIEVTLGANTNPTSRIRWGCATVFIVPPWPMTNTIYALDTTTIDYLISAVGVD